MKIYVKTYLAALLLLAGVPRVSAESYTHTVRFSADDLRLTETQVEGQTYTEISMKGLENGGEPGDPSLPYSVFHVSVPPEATDFTVSVKSAGTPLLYSLTANPMPVQQPVPTSIYAEEIAFQPLATKYTSSDIKYPDDQAEVGGISEIGGFNRVVSVIVYPVVWATGHNKLALIPQMEVTLNWKNDVKATANLLYPGFAEVIDEVNKETRELVVNPEAVGNYAGTLSGLNKSRRAAAGQTQIPYVIVTTRELSSSLERLAALRRLRGFNSKIVCIEDILADTRFKDGDVISGLNDDAGKLRAFLTAAYTDWGTQYVLLAGPFPQIPGRWVKCESAKEPDFVADLYFSNLTSSWKPGRNQERLREDLLTDYSTTLCTGRLNCRTASQINVYIDKLISYEFLPKGIDSNYLNDAKVIMGHDTLMHKSYPKYGQREFNAHFDHVSERFVSNSEEFRGKQGVEFLNDSFYGYVDFRCHGHYGGVGMIERETYHKIWYGINALDCDKGGFQEEEQNGLDNWKNQGHYNWSLSMSCCLGVLGQQECETLTFAESYLFGGYYGGVNFMCYTGPGRIGPSDAIEVSIFGEVVNNWDIGIGDIFAGKMCKDGKNSYQRKNGYYRFLVASLYNAGDPLTMLWAKQPREGVNRDNYFYEPGLMEDEFFRSGEYYLKTGNVGRDVLAYCQNTMKVTPRKNSIITFYRSDLKPYILPTEINGYNPGNNRYLFTGDLKIQSNLSDTADYGLHVDNGSTYTVESISSIELEGKLSTASNSSLGIKARDGVKVEKSVFSADSRIDIETKGEVFVGPNVTFEKGSVVMIH